MSFHQNRKLVKINRYLYNDLQVKIIIIYSPIRLGVKNKKSK